MPTSPGLLAGLTRSLLDQILSTPDDWQPTRTPAQEADYQRCLASAEYFIDAHCVIKSDRGDGLIPFTLFDYQRSVLAAIAANQQVIILKARQLGMTELVAAYAVWKTLKARQDVIILSQGEDEASELLNKARIAWEHLPDWLRVPPRNVTKTSTLELVNGSRILPKPATARAGRGLNAQLLIFDEWAHQQFQDLLYAAAAPAALSAGNQIIGISTANGVGNLFHRLWRQAESGKGMHPIFLPWHIRPGRDADWRASQVANMEAWMAAQEFPTSPEESFILSGRPRFDPEALTAIARTTLEPTLSDLDGGSLREWEAPVPGKRYVCGADTAEGLPKGDYCAATILDWESGLEVAELHGHWEPEVYARHLAALCRRYNDCLLGVERNNHGHAVLLALQSLERYTNLYRHSEYDQRTKAEGGVGWQTSSKSKPIMIDTLATVIRERRHYRNARFVDEARTYAVKDNGDTGASGNLHDDRVIAYAIAEQMRAIPEPEVQAPTFRTPAPLATRPGYRTYG